MYNLFKIVLCIIIAHAAYNLLNFFRFNYIEKIFFGMFSNDAEISNKNISLKNVVINYIKHAGVLDRKIPISQQVGNGFVSTGTVSVIQNISNRRQDIAGTSYELLLEARGNYWIRFINSINPFYWLRIIIFIPKYLLSYLRIDPESILIKIFQIVYWILGIIFTFLISVYPEKIQEFINLFIQFH